MPVVVTGATGGVGRVLVPMLAARGEVRAVVRRRSPSADALRSTGAKVASCDLADTAMLAVVMSGAHTVVHLAGGLDQPDDASFEAANFGTVRDALEAAAEAEVARFIFLSYPGASPSASNPYLLAKGRAEEDVRASDLDHVILRSTHVYGRGQRWLEEMQTAARRPLAAVVIGPGTQRIAPAFVDDVARTIVAADDRASSVQGTFALQGPDEVTADGLADLLAGRRRRKVHLSPAAAARVTRVLGSPMARAALEILAADSVADASDAAAEFRVARTALRPGLIESGAPPGR